MNSAFQVARKLPLKPGQGVPLERSTLDALASLPGMISVRFGADGQQLQLNYDASVIQIDAILAHCTRLGIQPGSRRRTRWKLAWYRFVDRNLRDNARHRPHCCNKAPKG